MWRLSVRAPQARPPSAEGATTTALTDTASRLRASLMAALVVINYGGTRWEGSRACRAELERVAHLAPTLTCGGSCRRRCRSADQQQRHHGGVGVLLYRPAALDACVHAGYGCVHAGYGRARLRGTPTPQCAQLSPGVFDHRHGWVGSLGLTGVSGKSGLSEAHGCRGLPSRGVWRRQLCGSWPPPAWEARLSSWPRAGLAAGICLTVSLLLRFTLPPARCRSRRLAGCLTPAVDVC